MMNEETGKKETSRRGLLLGSMFVLLGAFAASALNVIVRYLIPPPAAPKSQTLSIPTGQIPPGAGLVVEHRGLPVILVHNPGGFAAFKAACTHLGCLVKWVKEESIFYCPCHAGRFDAEGKVLSGPPPEPLHRVKIEIQDENIIFP